MTSRFRLLVFDWDGTLADSEARIVGCLEAALTVAELPPLPRVRLRSVVGLALAEAFEALLSDHRAPPIERLVAAFRSAWWAGDAAGVRLFQGAAEALRALRHREYRLAVATGKSRPGLDRELRHLGIGDLFVTSRCADEAPSKPHPAMLHDILAATGTEPDAALMIGDTDFDLRMAAAAGVASVAVTCGMHERERLAPCGPLALLDSVAALPAWLERGRRD